tara:strand:- start:6087 stop:6860 length:774 start_codon:yes stop_codon:yes gene_type:complete
MLPIIDWPPCFFGLIEGMQLKHCTWPQVEEYLKHKQTIIQPIGSTEQHGPTGIIGTDYRCAEFLAAAVGERSQTLVAPPLCVGMAEHHMNFPGSLSFRPSTYNAIMQDLFYSFAQHGFKNVFFINGHGGNVIPLQNAMCEWKARHDSLCFYLESWWRMPEVLAYEEQHFGDENGSHATCGEVALTMFSDAEAFEKIEKQNFKVEKVDYQFPLSAKEFREKFPDGRMQSNPGLSTKEHGEKLFHIACEALLERLSRLP